MKLIGLLIGLAFFGPGLAMAQPGKHLYPVQFHTWPERLWVYRYLPDRPPGGDACLGSTDKPIQLELAESEWNDPWLLYFVYSPEGPPQAIAAPAVAHMARVLPGELAGWGRYPQVGNLSVYLTPAQRWSFYRDRYGAWGVLGLGVLVLAAAGQRRLQRHVGSPVVDQLLGEELQSGDKLAGYEVVGLIGQGASATVYRVKDEQGREFALKRLRGDIDFEGRFRREMKALSQLRHPHLPYLQDYGEHQGRFYLVLELLGETDLRHVLGQGRVSESEALAYFRELVSVVMEVHRLGIIHRDIKPENVVFGQDGKLRLTDFGLSRGQGTTTITVEGTLLGTPAYMAPELMGGEPTSRLTDQYSLGCLAYELLTGRPPFLGETPIAVAVQHVHSEVPEPEGMAPWLWSLLRTMLAKEPAQRFPDLACVLKELVAPR